MKVNKALPYRVFNLQDGRLIGVIVHRFRNLYDRQDDGLRTFINHFAGEKLWVRFF
jgi:hypothetical protein